MMDEILIERALFDPGPWTFRTAEGSSIAHRLIDLERRAIIFLGMVTPSQDRIVELCVGDRMVSIAALDDPHGGHITWKIELTDLVSVF